jgi:hypothetical protein
LRATPADTGGLKQDELPPLLAGEGWGGVLLILKIVSGHLVC